MKHCKWDGTGEGTENRRGDSLIFFLCCGVGVGGVVWCG